MAIVAENCLAYMVLLVAAKKTGIILVPLNYRLAPIRAGLLVGKCSSRLVDCSI
ncbi:MAG: hypothetical protein R2795_16805 [Saprospiraceae bacterium]